jgi:hypothetical protein
MDEREWIEAAHSFRQALLLRDSPVIRYNLAVALIELHALTEAEQLLRGVQRDITTPVDLSQASGIGTYTTTVTLPSTWTASDGAYLTLGDVLDSATVTVNGTKVSVNQADRGRIDLGKTLKPGENTIEVRVATTMFNAVRKSGDGNYQMPAWQNTGLMGPVVLAPYRDTLLNTAADPTDPAPPVPPVPPVVKVATATKLKVTPTTVKVGERARAVVSVSSKSKVVGKVRVLVDGHVYRSPKLSKGRVVFKLPKLKLGRHRIRAVFSGSQTLKGSKSKAVTIKVVRNRR